MAYFIGIDGGAKKTACCLGDETRVLATATTGPSNAVRFPFELVRDNLRSAVEQVCKAARIAPSEISGVCVGAAGAGRDDVRKFIGQVLRDVVGGEIKVVRDIDIALETAFPSQPGVVVIAGTGSIAFGRNAQGQTARAGGWGYNISDEGSGYWIGRQAVSAVMKSHDRRRPTALGERVMRCLAADSFEQLVRKANSTPGPDFEELFPVVLELANADEAIAQELLVSAGRELATLAEVVIQRLDTPECRVGMMGGVFRHAALVRYEFVEKLRHAFPGASAKLVTEDPVVGALALARRG